MLKPHKHMNLNLSIIRVSALILKDLMQKGIVQYDDLLDKLIKKLGSDVVYVFPNALSFLYIRNVIQYHPINDSFEYLSRREHNEIK